MSEFPVEDLKSILQRCPEYKSDHHLGRPYMSAYQIAICFAQENPDHVTVQRLPIGGTDSGVHHSLAQRIARFLSRLILEGEDPEIEGAFLSHVRLHEMQFKGSDGTEIRVSTLGSEAGHSIFRWRNKGNADD